MCVLATDELNDIIERGAGGRIVTEESCLRAAYILKFIYLV